MCSPAAAAYVLMAVGAGVQMDATAKANQANRAITRYNVAVEQNKASEARKAGAIAAAEHRDKVRRLVSSQRANIAARGFDPDQGSYSDLQFETLKLGAMDSETIRYNAEMAALGHESAMVDLRFRQRTDDMKTGYSTASSLLTMGQAAYGAWGSMAPSKPPLTGLNAANKSTIKR